MPCSDIFETQLKSNMKNIRQKGITVFAIAALLSISIVQLYGVGTSLASHVSVKASTIQSPIPSNDLVCTMNDTNEKDTIPTEISIDKVGINLPIKRVTIANGTWAVTPNVANYAVETGVLSTEKGNIGLFAHDLQNGFENIKNLQNGDIITLKGLDTTATYSVYSKFSTIPSNVDVFSQTSNPIVTVITCDGLFFEKRYVVQASLIKLTKTNCHENII